MDKKTSEVIEKRNKTKRFIIGKKILFYKTGELKK